MKYGVKTVEVTQSSAEMQRLLGINAAFKDWLKFRNPGDRLPRGKYFKNKKSERKVLVLDEAWMLIGNNNDTGNINVRDLYKYLDS